MKRLKSILLVVLPFLALCTMQSCKVLYPNQMLKTDSNYDFDDFDVNQPEYVINLYDKLDVRVYTNNGIQLINTEQGGGNVQNQTSTLGYLVDSDSTVKLPTIGRVKVAGLTIAAAENRLEDMYKQYYQQPFVKVNVTNRRVIIFRSGSNSGSVLTINNEKFTLIEALAQAGGMDDLSKAYRIKVLRGDLKNPKVYLYNISSIEDVKKSNLVLQSNDIIYVERRPKYVQRTLSEIAPYVSLLNTVMLIYLMAKNF
ncbi:MAG: polysaccharide biosynthesis/export family protein [Salinivirgaceae bacterium]|jgi:polysaccharide export outer membrane protein|nr:polysaccharide biosynthesis/export family protein [Salinivirgaceae bacterium]